MKGEGACTSQLLPQPTVASVNPVAIGTNATLTCTIDDVLRGANVSYQWTKNGVPLSGSTQANLNIINVGIVDQGAYGCGISVGGVSNSSTTVNLTIIVPQPTVASVNPVAIGTNATLTCTIDDVLRGANVSYQWTKNGVLLSGRTQANLNIINVGIVDQGAYGCGISVGGVSISSTTVNLTIFVPQPTVASVNPVAIGTNATLTCTIDDVLRGANVSYQWTKNGVPLSGRTQANLNIINVGIVDQGAYGCGISVGGVSNSSTTVNLTIIVPQPTITSINPVAIGTNATLTCTIDDVLRGANVSYQWTKNGVPLPGSTQANLNIINVGIVDQGAYGCGISVDGVSNSSTTVNLTIFGPSFVVSLNNMTTVLLNTNFVLRCVASSPSPTLVPSWTFPAAANATGGVTIVTVTQESVVNSTLIVTSVGSGGGGVYTCAFTSRLPEDGINSSTTVVVLGPPQITGFPGDNVTMTTANATQSSSYTMKCSVAPGVTPSILTLSLQKVLPNGTSIQLNTTISSTSVSFTLQSPLLSDTGVYSCIATNAIGNDTKQLNLIVQAPPDPVNTLTITRVLISFNRIRITWSPPASNNAPITSYIVAYCVCDPATLETLCPVFGPETPAVTSMTSADIAPVALNRVYSVSLVAVNSVGNSSAAYYYMNTTTSDDITPLNFTTVFVSTSAVIVTWSLSPLNVFTADPFPVQLTSFTLCFSRVASTLGQCLVIPSIPNQYQWNATGNLTGVSTGSPPDRYLLALNLTANYSIPLGSSSPAVVTVNVTSVAVSNIQATPSVNPVSNTVAFSWDSLVPAAQRPFISQYLFQYSVTTLYTIGQRGRRQSSFSPTSTLSTTGTSTTVPRAPYSQYSYQVSAMYASGFTAPITGISSFNTSDYQTAAGPPQNLRVGTGSTYSTIPLEWSVPTAPNGAISSYTLTVTTPNTSPFSITLNSTTFSYSVSGLKGYTPYTITMVATNGFGPGTPSQVTSTTPYAVCTPSLQLSSSIGTSFTVTITTSDLCGPLSYYRVIVGKDSTVPPSGLTYWSSQTQFNVDRYYVLYINDVVASGNNTVSFTFTQTLTQATYNNVMYSIVAPEPGTYFLTVLLYSMVDKTVFSSSVSVTFTVPAMTDNAAAIIIGVVASVAILLLAIFLVLLIVAIVARRPKVRQSHDIAHTNGDGVKTRTVDVELKRRTKILSPNLAVGSSDVFTSAGQPTTLVCEVSGTPPPEVTWEKVADKERGQGGENTQLLEKQTDQPLDKQRFVQLSDHSLVILGTDLQDEGVYIVKATNPGGTVDAMVKVTVTRPVPPEPDCEHPSIPVDSFTERIAMLRNDNGAGLEDEYADVELEWNFTSYCANLNVNKSKNRYVNIIPYDHSRVVLPLQDNILGSDYINSSFIDGFNKTNAYIATQGPMPSTFADFWRMVWEYDCPTIVMVTNLQEEDKVKCHQYWPSYGSTTYGHIKVTSEGGRELGRVQHPYIQRHTNIWSEPLPYASLLSFRKRITKYHPNTRGPMVVHCSAGVGRTGTFICIDYVLKQIEGESIVDIFNFVRHMRYRRNYMVQTSAQYIFIHDAILESVMCGDTSIPASELKDRMATMRQVDPESQIMKIETQFETLNTASPMDKDFDCSIAELPDNQKKNRFDVHLPSNNFRVTLSGDKNQSDYICASFLDGYRQRSAFIITQAPMTETVGDFWRMIWEHKSAAIVMLAQLIEDGKEVCVRYWPEETNHPEVFGKYQVEKSAEDRNESTYIIRKFKICSIDNPQDNRMITQFHYLMWPNRAAPENTKSIVELIDELQRMLRKSGNGPITVHCNDGIGRTGSFCAAYSMMDRFKVEQVVDAFQTIKSMRIQRAGLLDSLAQYIFLHSAVLEFLSTFDAYQNFK
ncbi:hypothetical protein EMCRGX_G018961 [Ephydatia muelleri]